MVADKPGERAEEEKVVLSKTEIFEEHPGRVGQRKSPVLIIVMGVSGCGKSSVGAGLAAKVRWRFRLCGIPQAPASCGVRSRRERPTEQSTGVAAAAAGKG